MIVEDGGARVTILSFMKSLLFRVGKSEYSSCFNDFYPKVAFLQPTEPVEDKGVSKEAEEAQDGLEVALNEEADARNPRYLFINAV